MAIAIADLSPTIDRDMLLTGAILHDIGKSIEYRVLTQLDAHLGCHGFDQKALGRSFDEDEPARKKQVRTRHVEVALELLLLLWQEGGFPREEGANLPFALMQAGQRIELCRASEM